ncbi:MAG: CAP domain-containing protein [Oscillospiraceae bacterium]|nr:CAP domain-containing protein [Oscillospiraceae bacterium]
MDLSIRKTFAVFVSALIMMLGLTVLLAAPVSAAQKVGLSKTSVTLEVGQTTTLKLNGVSGGTVTWSMSDKSIAKYSKGGKVTAVSEGTAYIYAKYNGKKYKCKVTVVPAEKEAIEVNDESTVRVKKGGTVKVYIYTDVSSMTVGCSDESVCSFTGAALSDGSGYRLTLKGKKNGTAAIMLYDSYNSSNNMTFDVQVGSVSDDTVYMNFGSAPLIFAEADGFIFAGTWGGDGSSANESENTSSSASAVDEVIELINKERAAAGKSALKKNDELCKNAQLRASEIGGYFSHTRPDGTDCFTAITVPYGYAGENIAKGQRNAEEVMDCWMNSSGHKKNILSSNYTSVGVGYDPSTNSWVQIFISE